MTPEEKQLLLIDLCARIPHGFIVHRYGDNCDISINNVDNFAHFLEYSEGEEFKPYLRPMSSMTEKETFIFRQDILNEIEARCIHSFGCGKYTLAFTEANDWLNEHHFDYRGLIPMGLALEAPEDMYKSK